MLKRGDIILVDTTLILAAHRYKCWNSFVNNFRIETVERCVEECATGNNRHRNVFIDTVELRKCIKVHKVDCFQMAMAVKESRKLPVLDPGEKELLSHAFNRRDFWMISSQDAGCISAGNELGFLDRFVSPEELAEVLGLNISFNDQFTKKWLVDLRSKIKLEFL
jgi:hypothetical protein